jgi:hypothetical protein
MRLDNAVEVPWGCENLIVDLGSLKSIKPRHGQHGLAGVLRLRSHGERRQHIESRFRRRRNGRPRRVAVRRSRPSEQGEDDDAADARKARAKDENESDDANDEDEDREEDEEDDDDDDEEDPDDEDDAEDEGAAVEKGNIGAGKDEGDDESAQ